MESLKPLLYFSIFNYPLKQEEVFDFSCHIDNKKVEEELEIGLAKGIIKKTNEYYHPNLALDVIQKREIGYDNAKKAILKARKNVRFISLYFPFIEGVAISGSLSKGYFDKESDIDYFIITKPNHLWTCRTLLVLYKKIFLFNSKKYFCMNYFITSDNLEIQEKNRFTATEIATLIPMYGEQVFLDFYKANTWTYDYFPNKKLICKNVKTFEKSYLARQTEKILSGSIGSKLEDFFFNLTFKFWKLKFKNKLSEHDFSLAFKSSKRISKHHPSNFQKKVITALNIKYDEIHSKYNVELTKENV